MIIHFNGKWDGTSYVGGDAQAVNIPDKGCDLSTLIEVVHGIVQDELTAYYYDIFELVDAKGKLYKLKINSDEAVEKLLISAQTPEFYVHLQSIKSAIVDPCEKGFIGSCTQTGFVDLMNTFNAFKGRRDEDNNVESNTSREKEFRTENEVYTESADSFDDASDDSWDSSDDYLSFENPSEVPPENHTSCENNTVARPWIIPGFPSSLPPPRQDSPPLKATPGVLCKDDTFLSKDDMYTSVGYYHLFNAVEYRVKRSDTIRWYLRCKHENCDFLFRASGEDGLWRTLKFTAHTCRVDPDCNAPRSLPSKVIGSFYAANQLEKSTSKTPKEIMQDLKSNYGVSIRYNQAVRSRQRANVYIYGNSEQSFNLLPSYLHQLKVANPQSHVRLHTDHEHRFKYVFYALRVSINGFINYGRPVIVVDGTHLKGKYKGVVFVAVTQDCNHQVFPLATGIGDVENNESWTWFLSRLREAYGCPTDLLIVSDQHKSIVHAMSTVYPDATHGLCYYHLQKKFVVHSKKMVGHFNRAAYAYRPSEYQRFMDIIKRVDSGKIFESLMNAKPERWSRVHCPVKRYEFMTSNAAES
ncbi:hypothetical protein ACS0TY_011066 [Phlomoides rotata]